MHEYDEKVEEEEEEEEGAKIEGEGDDFLNQRPPLILRSDTGEDEIREIRQELLKICKKTFLKSWMFL